MAESSPGEVETVVLPMKDIRGATHYRIGIEKVASGKWTSSECSGLLDLVWTVPTTTAKTKQVD